MPEGYFKGGRFPGKLTLTLEGSARDHLLIGMYCSTCRRLTWFMASDLVKIYNPRLGWYVPLFACNKCGSDEYVSIRQRLPESGDYGSLIVRRPAGIRYTQIWTSVTLGEEPPDLGYPGRDTLLRFAGKLRHGGLIDEEDGPFLKAIVEGIKLKDG